MWLDLVAEGLAGIDLRAWSHQGGGVDVSGGRTQPHKEVQRPDTTVWTTPMQTTPSHVSFSGLTYRAGGGVSVAHVQAHVGARYAVRNRILANVLWTVLCGCTRRTRSSPPGKAVGASAMMLSQVLSRSMVLVAFDFCLGRLVPCLPISASCAATSAGSGSSAALSRRGRLWAGLPGVVGWAAVSGSSALLLGASAAGPFALSAPGSSLLRASGFAEREESSIIGSGLASIVCRKARLFCDRNQKSSGQGCRKLSTRWRTSLFIGIWDFTRMLSLLDSQ